jgi:hypothetical protein
MRSLETVIPLLQIVDRLQFTRLDFGSTSELEGMVATEDGG